MNIDNQIITFVFKNVNIEALKKKKKKKCLK